MSCGHTAAGACAKSEAAQQCDLANIKTADGGEQHRACV